MREYFIRTALILLALAVVITGCQQGQQQGSGSGTPPAESVESGIDAVVVNSTSGSAVAGSSVVVFQSGTEEEVANATTGDDGAFSLNLPPGNYDLLLKKEGYAGSKVINVRVVENKRTFVPIIQREATNPNWATTPPEVTLTGVKDGDVFDALFGYIPYRVTASAESPLDIDIIYAAVGKTPGARLLTGRRDIFVNTNDTGDQFIDPLNYAAAGDTTFQVVVYDTNGNRTQIYRYITITFPFVGNVDLLPPQLQVVLSYTLSKQIKFFSAAPQAAPEGTNLFVLISWRPTVNFDKYISDEDIPYGWHIYRSFDGENFERIATVPGYQFTYIDPSPLLTPGVKTYYRVTAFVGNQESEPSNILETTPLEPFFVRIDEPTDNATNVPTIPTFKWHPTATVSEYHYYAGALWDTLTGDMAWFTNPARLMLVNRTEWTWNEDGAYSGTPLETLQRGRTYEWNLIEAYALDDPLHPTAVSIASDGLGILFPYGVASTDHFTFTTQP